jgi:drug/metabolite transporter (DMT)-like permease
MQLYDKFQEQVTHDHVEISWYYACLAILVGAAMLSHGSTMIAQGWEKELKLPAWFSIIGTIFGMILSIVLGSIVGYLIWDWMLGGIVALVGAFSSTLVLSIVRSRLDAAKETIKSAVVPSEEKQNKK